MARFLTALALLPAAAVAFCTTQTSLRVGNTYLAAKNAQDQARSAPKWTQKRSVYNDDFDAPIPADPQSGTTVLESAPVVDDECYMGANMQLAECADFDPPIRPDVNFQANTPTYNDDFDAPILADPQSGTTVLESAPVVDDECYMGANMQLAECADFDPPLKKANRSTNAMDTPRGKKARDMPKWASYNDDFDAPIPVDPQSGTTVLESAPVVDDECYMGANMQLDECADFDPPKQVSRSTNVPSYNDDFDAPIPADPQSGTTVLEDAPVVDDECYMGANGQLDECADFDPPKQVNLWTNVLDTPAGKKQRDLPNWAKKS